MGKKGSLPTYNYMGMGIPYPVYNPTEKQENAMIIQRYMLNRTRRMFKWEGLPDSIPERSLELMLQTKGCVCFTKVNDEVYVFTGSLGGVPDAYYMPTEFIVANPYLNFSKSLKINEECVVMPSDSLYMGLLPIFAKYSSMLAENELTMNCIDIMSRSALVFRADDTNEYNSAQDYIKRLKEGELSVISSSRIYDIDGVDVQPGATASASIITNLIELEQYIKSVMYNEIGLNANWNAKRETITSSETLLNSDTLLPLIDDMLFCRQEFAEKVNEMFGLNISVDYASAWEDNAEELELEHEKAEAEIEGTEDNESEEEGPAEEEVKEDEDKEPDNAE